MGHSAQFHRYMLKKWMHSYSWPIKQKYWECYQIINVDGKISIVYNMTAVDLFNHVGEVELDRFDFGGRLNWEGI